MRVSTKLLTAFLCFGVLNSAEAQQTPIARILDSSKASLDDNLKTLDTYYDQIRKKSGALNGTELKQVKISKKDDGTEQAKILPQVFKEQVQNVNFARSSYDRDPFAYTNRIKLIDPIFGGAGVSYSPKPINSHAALPRLQMKGFLSGGEENSIGLLEIEGMGVHVVRKGDVVGLQQVELDAVIRIIDMSSLGLIVETGSSGQAAEAASIAAMFQLDLPAGRTCQTRPKPA